MADPVRVDVPGSYFKHNGQWQSCFIWTDSLAAPMVTFGDANGFNAAICFARAATLFTRNGIQIDCWGNAQPDDNFGGLGFNIIQPNAQRWDAVNWNGFLGDLSTASPGDLKGVHGVNQ